MSFSEQRMSRLLRDATADARVMAVVFCAGGAMGVGIGFVGRDDLKGLALMASASVLLLGPGVVYALVARALKRADGRVATFGLRVAIVHIVVAAACMAAWLLIVRGMSRTVQWALLPGVLSVFLVPAMAAFVYHLVYARRAARQVSSEGHGFAVRPVPALPVDATEPGA